MLFLILTSMAGVVGFEPTDAEIKILCLDQLGYTPSMRDQRKRKDNKNSGLSTVRKEAFVKTTVINSN